MFLNQLPVSMELPTFGSADQLQQQSNGSCQWMKRTCSGAITVHTKLALVSNKGVFMETAPLQRTDVEENEQEIELALREMKERITALTVEMEERWEESISG